RSCGWSLVTVVSGGRVRHLDCLFGIAALPSRPSTSPTNSGRFCQTQALQLTFGPAGLQRALPRLLVLGLGLGELRRQTFLLLRYFTRSLGGLQASLSHLVDIRLCLGRV